MDTLGPALGALAFVGLMWRVREPARLTFNSLLVTGASGAYIGSGLGVWELVFPALLFPINWWTRTSYRALGIAWWLHSGWDLVHHLWADPIWPFAETSSWGCLVFDLLIGAWLFTLAPRATAAAEPTAAPRGRSGSPPEAHSLPPSSSQPA